MPSPPFTGLFLTSVHCHPRHPHSFLSLSKVSDILLHGQKDSAGVALYFSFFFNLALYCRTTNDPRRSEVAPEMRIYRTRRDWFENRSLVPGFARIVKSFRLPRRRIPRERLGRRCFSQNFKLETTRSHVIQSETLLYERVKTLQRIKESIFTSC